MAYKINGTSEEGKFLELNPQWRAFRWVKEMEVDYSEDFADKLLWGFFYMYHPTSVYSDYMTEEKKEALQTDLFLGKMVNWSDEKIIEYSILFQNAIVSKAKRLYQIWESKFEELTYQVQMIDLRTPAGRKEFKELSEKVPAIFKAVKQFESLVKEEEMTEHKGGVQSASDSGELNDQ